MRSTGGPALGLTEGPIHAEFRLTNDGPRVIEVNARSIGGLCSRVLRFGTGMSLEELLIRHALDHDFAPPERQRLAAGVMMIPIPRAGRLVEIRGLDDAKAVSGIEDVTISAAWGNGWFLFPRVHDIQASFLLGPTRHKRSKRRCVNRTHCWSL